MNIRRAVYLLSLAAFPAFGAQMLPYPPSSAETYITRDDAQSKTLTLDSNKVRIKISAFSNGERGPQVRLGGVVVCSESACYKPVTTGYFDL